MTLLIIVLNIMVAIWCWRMADDVEPYGFLWLVLLICSAWNAVEAVNGIIGV